jgi:hypothetical protein
MQKQVVDQNNIKRAQIFDKKQRLLRNREVELRERETKINQDYDKFAEKKQLK